MTSSGFVFSSRTSFFCSRFTTKATTIPIITSGKNLKLGLTDSITKNVLLKQPSSVLLSQLSSDASSSFSNENNNKNNNLKNSNKRSDDLWMKDTLLATVHVIGCVGLAIVFCLWENYDCSHLKPLSSTLRPMAIKGLGYGQLDRLEDWRGQQVTSGIKGDDITISKIPSYNEIMERHRVERVPRWIAGTTLNNQDVASTTVSNSIGIPQIKGATQDIYNALEAVDTLKGMADEYEWDDMRKLIRSPVLSSKIDEACSILRGAVGFISYDGRQEIGFDWGSCAWRHCGAEADAQEALAEFYNLLGVLEPFECRFVMDIVERSLRDILIVIPRQYHQERTIHPYIPYEPVGQADGETWMDENGEKSNNMALDVEFLNALKFLRSKSDD